MPPEVTSKPSSPILAQDEVIIFSGRNSAVRLLGPGLTALFWLAIGIVLLAADPICQRIVNGAGESGAWASTVKWIARTMSSSAVYFFLVLTVMGWAIVLLLVVWRMGWVVWTWLFTHNLLTNHRIEHERGFFNKKVTTLELWRVQDLECDTKFPWDFFFRTGRIKVKADVPIFSKANDYIGPIHNARSVFDQLKTARLKAGQKAGAQAMGVVG